MTNLRVGFKDNIVLFETIGDLEMLKFLRKIAEDAKSNGKDIKLDIVDNVTTFEPPYGRLEVTLA